MANNDNKYDDELQDWEGDPKYSEKDDIFSKGKKLNINPDDIGKVGNDQIEYDGESELNYEMDEGLDVPGADLDDEDELIGEEDEENNYYSLGGDDHDDLEEGEND